MYKFLKKYSFMMQLSARW